MNVKGLLFGSAAAVVAVSGARAADAVVIAEPEPFEYVRVCDTYGVGFYYIPGTETCLSINGLIRYDIDFSEDNDYTITDEDRDAARDYFGIDSIDDIDDLDDAERFELATLAATVGISSDDLIADIDIGDEDFVQPGLDEGWAKQAIARINIDARSETEWGTFRRFIRLQADTDGIDDEDNFDGIYGLSDTGGVEVIYAYVELGGLLVGLYDTLWDGDFDAVDSDNWGGTSAHQIRYTFSGSNGMTFQVSIEEQDFNYDYTPNVVGRIGLTQGWGGLAVFAAYDATFEEFGIKGLASINFTDAITLELGAVYESGFGDFSVVSGNGLTGYEFTLGAALNFKATDQLALAVYGQYFGDQHWIGHDNYVVGAEANWTPVENLLLRAQVDYNGGDSQDFVDGRLRLEAAF